MNHDIWHIMKNLQSYAVKIVKGITIVITALDTKGVTSYLGNFKQKIAFELPVEKYADIFTGKVGLIKNTPGRGFANVTVKPEGVTGTFRMNLPYEVQCALPTERKTQRKAATQKKVLRKTQTEI